MRSPVLVSFCKGSPLHHHTSPTNGGVRNGSGYSPTNSPDDLLKRILSIKNFNFGLMIMLYFIHEISGWFSLVWIKDNLC